MNMHGGCVKFSCALLCACSSVAMAADPVEEESMFTSGYWSQVQPAQNFEYGCRTGWRAFRFGTQGYFLYDGRISGHWWLDHGRNVRLWTSDGQVLILFFDGGGTLMKRRLDAAPASSVFGTELRLYRRCDTAADTVIR